MSDEEIRKLEHGKYLSFATLKKSGEYVPTPVWFAVHEGNFFIFSAPDTGKIKRLSNFSECRLASCDYRGKITGPWLNARAELLEEIEDSKHALAVLRRKYGWQMKLTDGLSTLTGKMRRRIYIRVRPM
jgi:hypothetical protein